MTTLTKILKAIWGFVNSKFLGYAVAIVLVLMLAQTCKKNSDLKKEKAQQEQNMAAKNDTLHQQKLKTGELQFTIDGYIASVKDLKNINKDLADEVDKQKGTVVNLNKVVVLLMQDTTDLRKYINEIKSAKEKPTKVNDTTYSVPWTLAYSYDSLNYDLFKGRTKIGLTVRDKSLAKFDFSNVNVLNEGSELLTRMTQMELVYGQKYVKGKLVVFANSKYPGFHVVNMEGFTVPDPPKKHWFTGWNVQLGITPTWDFVNKKPIIVVGPSIGWSIYQW
jgi:hypothetical protein